MSVILQQGPTLKKQRVQKTAALFVLLLLMPLLIACDRTDDIGTVPKMITDYGSRVHLEGKWRIVANTSYISAGTIGSVDIECNKQSRKCREICAWLFPPDKLIKSKFLSVVELTYDVTEWSDQVIRAIYRAPVKDFELKISFKDKFAERRVRETRARGVETSDPNVYTNYVLE
jgi:hypothetical protein